MATPDKLVRKGSYEDFYYADIVDSSKSSASKYLTLQFEKMRENLAQAGINPQAAATPASKGVKFQAFDGNFKGLESSMQTPTRVNPVVDSPAFTMPKPILIVSPASITPSKIYSRPNSPARSRLPSAEKIKVPTPQDKPPSPPPKDMGVNPVVFLPDRPDIVRTLGSPKTSFREDNGTMATVNTFRGLKKCNSGSFRDEVHLHHDVFLATQNDSIAQAVEAISRRRQEVVSRYPQASEIDYNIRPETKNVQCTVPSHVVSPKTERARSAPRGSSGATGGTVRGGIAYTAERPRSVTPTSTTIRTIAGNSIQIPMLSLQSTAASSTSGVQSSQKSVLNVKNVALNPAMYRTGSKGTLTSGVEVGSTNSLSHLRISPTTVLEAGEQPKNASPTIKASRKKFDFGASQSLVTPPKPPLPTPVASTAQVSGMSGSKQSVKGVSTLSTPAASATTTPLRKVGSVTRNASTTPSTAVRTTPNSAPAAHVHRTPDKSSPSAGSTASSASKASARSVSRGHYRPLTAAEISAAACLNAKLNAANLANNRPESAGVQPGRSMSRALSQLVFNVRDN